MKRTIRCKAVRWGDKFQLNSTEQPIYPNVDGAIEYEISQEYSSEELLKILKPGQVAVTEQELDKMQQSNAPHEVYEKIGIINPYSFTAHQPFSRKGLQQINGRNIWSWDGNREAPSLTPSWLMNWENIKIHLFFTAGKINLLSDSNAVLID